MTPREAIIAAIDHREVRPVPYQLSIDEPVAKRMDEHFGSAEWRKSVKNYFHYSYTADYMHKDPLNDGSGLYRDWFGSLWQMGSTMHLVKPAMSSPSFEGFDWPKPERFLVDAKTIASIQADCEANADRFKLGCIWWGLMETSWGLRGFENILMDCVAEEDFYEELLERVTQLYLAFVDHVCTHLPIDAILFGDDWGDQRGVIIGPERWRRFMKPRWARIYDRVHSHGCKVITHCCGSIVDILDDLVEIGLDCWESVQPEARDMNPYGLKRRWGNKLAFWGCLGSQSTMPFGTPQEVTAEIRRLCREMGKGGGYILSAAKSLQPETPTANAVAALEAFNNQEG